MKRLVLARFKKKKLKEEEYIYQVKSAYNRLIAAKSAFSEVTDQHAIDKAVSLLQEAEENYRRVMNQVRTSYKRGRGNELNNNHDLD